MKSEHFADFGAFLIVAIATSEAAELHGSLGVRLGQNPAHHLRPEAIEEIDQNLKITVHCPLNARVRETCQKSPKNLAAVLVRWNWVRESGLDSAFRARA